MYLHAMNMYLHAMDMYLHAIDMYLHAMDMYLHAIDMYLHAMNMYLHAMDMYLHAIDMYLHAIDMYLHAMDMYVLIPISRNEVHFIRISGLIRTLTANYNLGVSLSLYMAITFIVFVKTGGILTPRRVIVVLSLLTFLRTVGATFLIRAIFLLFEAKVALTRIQVCITCMYLCITECTRLCMYLCTTECTRLCHVM